MEQQLILPNTDSPEVMERAVACWMTHQIWDRIERIVHDDDAEKTLTEIYDRVYRNVKKTHGA